MVVGRGIEARRVRVGRVRFCEFIREPVGLERPLPPKQYTKELDSPSSGLTHDVTYRERPSVVSSGRGPWWLVETLRLTRSIGCQPFSLVLTLLMLDCAAERLGHDVMFERFHRAGRLGIKRFLGFLYFTFYEQRRSSRPAQTVPYVSLSSNEYLPVNSPSFAALISVHPRDRQHHNKESEWLRKTHGERRAGSDTCTWRDFPSCTTGYRLRHPSKLPSVRQRYPNPKSASPYCRVLR